MNRRVIKILLIEDNRADALMLQDALEQDPLATFESTTVERLSQGMEQLQSEAVFDAVLLDLGLPDTQGIDSCQHLLRQFPDIPLVVLSGLADEETALQAVQSGAQDYLVKGAPGWAAASRAIRYAIERQQSQLALKASVIRFRAMIEHNTEAIALLSADGTILYESPSVERFFGYLPEENIGHNAFEYLHPDDQARGAALLQQLLNQPQTPITFIFRYRHKNGTWLWVEATGSNLLAEMGVRALVINYRDITERKRAEEAMSEREALYRGVIETSTDGFLLVDRQGRILEVNDAYVVRSGYARATLLSMSIQELESPQPDAPREALLRHKLIDGDDLFDTWHRAQDGRRWPVEINTSYTPVSGGRFFIFVRDITQRKRAETLLRTRLQLAELTRHGRSLDDLLRFTLDAAEVLTGSQIGFFHFVNDDQETLSLQCWSTNTLERRCRVDGTAQHEHLSQAGVWADCVRQQTPVVHNDYASLAENKGLPEGHAPLQRELVVPVMRGGLVTAVIGVGNKRDDYLPEDVEILQELASLVMETVLVKRAEQALAESEAHYRQAITAAEAIPYRLDYATDSYTFIGENVVRVIGINAKTITPELYNSLVEDAVMQGDFKGLSVSEAIQLIRQGDPRPWRCDYHIRSVNGEDRWLSDSSVQVRDAAGKPTAAIGIVMDITERKLTEQALERSNQRLRNLRAIDHALLRWELDGAPAEIEALQRLIALVPCEVISLLALDCAQRRADLIARIGRDQEVSVEAKPALDFDAVVLPETEAGQLVVRDLTPDALEIESLRKAYQLGRRAMACLPLLVRGKVIGLLRLTANQPGFFSDEYIEIAVDAADQLALSLYQSQLVAEIRQYTERLEQRVAERTEALQQANLSFSEALAFNQAIIDNAPLGIGVCRADGQCILSNDGMNAIAGGTAKEILLQNFNQLDAWQKSGMADAASKALRTGQETRLESHVNTSFGREVWLSCVFVPFENQNETLLLLMIEDISERYRAEIALRESQERLVLAARSAGLGIWEWNTSNGRLIWDEQMYTIFGLSAETFDTTITSWISLIHPDDASRLTELMHAVVNGETHYHTEYRAIRPDGAIRTIVSAGMILFDAQSQAERMIGICQDVTSQKEMEQALRQSEAIYRALFEKANDAIFLLTPDIRYEKVNPKACELLGCTIDEINHEQGTRFVAPEEVPQTREKLTQILAGETIPIYERTFIDKNGQRIPVDINLSLIRDENGQPMYIQSVVRDITVRKHAEETLRHSEESLRLANTEMARALRMKDEFLANMSHELRTPLNAVLSISESLEEQVSGGLNPKQLRYVRMINESGQHLLSLINDILDLSKIEAGRLTLEMQPTAVEPLCHASLRLIRELAQKKNLNVAFFSDGQVQFLAIDERRIKQALVNLLSNAVKFTPADGKIGLELRGDPQTCQVHFTVWDTGIGISAEDRSRLFSPFVQLDGSLARGYGGTGLGLVLVARMVRLHGGSVSVESTPGQGSRFIISLPWETDVEATRDDLTWKHAPAPNEAAARGSVNRLEKPDFPARLLLVEDVEAMVMVTVDTLEAIGYQVIVARDGASGVMQAKKERPDLILMDIQLPGMDGFEATQKIRSDPSLQHIPIIALTALAMSGDRERCLAAGMVDYLSKPLDLKDLAKIVKAQLQRARESADRRAASAANPQVD